MAILDKEILSYVNTQANLIALLGVKYRGIDTDQTKNWSYKDGVGDFHVTANQKYWDGSDWVYENPAFGNVDVSEYIRLRTATTTNIRFQTNEITINSNGIAGLNIVYDGSSAVDVQIGGNVSMQGYYLAYDGTAEGLQVQSDNTIAVKKITTNTTGYTDVLKLYLNTSNTADDGLGTAIAFYSEDDTSVTAVGARIAMLVEEATNPNFAGSLNFYVYNYDIGATPITKMTMNSVNSVIYGKLGIGVTPLAMFHIYQSGCPADPYIYLDNGDITHGVTSQLPTSVFYGINVVTESSGGANMIGISSDATNAIRLTGTIGTQDTTTPVFNIVAARANGTGRQALTTNNRLFTVWNYTTPVLDIDASGNVALGGSPIYVASQRHLTVQNSGICGVYWRDSSQATNTKNWNFRVNGLAFEFQSVNDALSASQTALRFVRNAGNYTIDYVQIPYTLLSGAIISSGNITTTGSVAINTVANEGTTATKILTLDASDNVDYRTPAELLADMTTPSSSWSPIPTGLASVNNSFYNYTRNGDNVTVTFLIDGFKNGSAGAVTMGLPVAAEVPSDNLEIVYGSGGDSSGVPEGVPSIGRIASGSNSVITLYAGTGNFAASENVFISGSFSYVAD